jgi:2-polyprenyl-6-methoxyphenol hydroxylase-like FAD-dependent oxidoreductase
MVGVLERLGVLDAVLDLGWAAEPAEAPPRTQAESVDSTERTNM